MNDQLALEAQLSLYGDTVCRDTGHYFCTARPFANPRIGNNVSLLSCGKTAFLHMHRAMRKAKHFIWIADWQMSYDVELLRASDPSRPNRLHRVIEEIIMAKPVHVKILLYCSVSQYKPGTFDKQAKEKIEALNKPGYLGTVAVLLQLPTSDQKDSWDYSHHQKFVVIDGQIGFLGGIDLANGRWETPNFDVVVDPEKFVINEMYNPGAKKARGLTSREKKLIEDFDFAPPWWEYLLDEGCQPRMPWQDVHIKIEGPSVIDIHRNFARRWNQTMAYSHGSKDKTIINKRWLEKIGAWNSLCDNQRSKPGSAIIQIVRSVSRRHLREEGLRPDDIELYGDLRERELWKKALPQWKDLHQDNILNAMLNCIRSADNYVYIESQFFISGFGKYGKHDSKKIGNEDNGIQNKIANALSQRICENIKAGTLFHVYLVIPAHPEGDPSSGIVWQQQWQALAAIKHGSTSIINTIKSTLLKAGRAEDEWNQYFTILNMRNFGATVQYARNLETNNEDYKCEIGRFVVTEQIYIHSKLLIVDDAVAIIGSANINDRSLTGNGDTEIAAVVVDTNDVNLTDLGSPQYKVQTRKFARDLRKQLWRKHFGFDIEEKEYFDSSLRAIRNQVSPSARLPFPPRMRTTEDALSKICGLSFEQILEKPCAPEVVKAVQAIAKSNRQAYEQVFTHTPRDFEQFSTGQTHYTLPYPLTVDKDTVSELKQVTTSLPDPQRAARLSVEEREKILQTKTAEYDYWIAQAKKDNKHLGVIPPRLQSAFMTKKLTSHQKKGLKNVQFGRRQQLYGDEVHDVEKAISFLQERLVGFFVEAPLDWGQKAEVGGNPSKFKTIDLSQLSTEDPSKNDALG